MSPITMTRAIRRLETDGHQTRDEVLAVLSPYQTAHINRFGNYLLNFGRDPQPIQLDFRKPFQPEPAVAKVLAVPGPESGLRQSAEGSKNQYSS